MGPLIADGGLATTLMARGRLPVAQAQTDGIHGLLRREEAQIASVHRAFVEAGSQLLLTGTFLLPSRPPEPSLAEAALRAAQRASAGKAKIFASIGPASAPDRPAPLAPYRQLVQQLLGRVDGIYLETFTCPKAALRAFEAIRPLTGTLPVVISLTVRPDGRRFDGGSTAEALRTLAKASPHVGLNCGALQSVEAALEDWDGPLLWLRPGILGDEEGWVNGAAALAPKAAVLGGCCGVTPDLIRALVARLEGDPCSP